MKSAGETQHLQIFLSQPEELPYRGGILPNADTMTRGIGIAPRHRERDALQDIFSMLELIGVQLERQERAYACCEFRNIEGLDQKIVYTQFDALELIRKLIQRGQHDDRYQTRPWICFEFLADCIAIELRHHNVK